LNSILKLPRDQVEALRPRDVQHYLTSRGWTADATESSSKATLYRHPLIDEAEIVLPLRRDLGDYTLRMADVVQNLSVLERRSVWEVLNDLSVPPGDLLRLRVTADEATSGNLPLDQGIQLLRGGRDALLAAACSVKRPQPFHSEKRLKDAGDFIKNCRLGQTERGSFVATIITPVPPAIPPLLPFADEISHEATEPFPRRVTTRLMSSLQIVEEAARTERLAPILNWVADGVSANLCDALVAMKPRGIQSRLDIHMSWAWSGPQLPAGVPQVISFTQAVFPFIKQAGRQLRERAVPVRMPFVGKVIGLQSEIPTFFDNIMGKVILRTEVNGRPARIKVVLNRDDYKKACDAHRDKRRVAVTGIVHPDAKVRVYEISEPQDFQVLDGP
jgi:hypothetical protein